jgi:CheY-like chemotaxis protein
MAQNSYAHLPDKPNQLPVGHERILFVDDEALIVKMASRMLGQLGYSVTTRTCSAEALELFRSNPKDYDLVISDVTMPIITGDQLTKKLIEIRPDIPVILCTGYSKRITEQNAFEIGIKAFVNKPIVQADLATIVRRVLDEAKNKN